MFQICKEYSRLMNMNLRGNIAESLGKITDVFLELLGKMKVGRVATSLKGDLKRLSDCQVQNGNFVHALYCCW